MKKEFRSFTSARRFVHKLKLKNQKEWGEYCKSGDKPDDIPRNPRHYKKEWKGMGDWLGTGRIADQYKVYRPFKEARRFVHKLKLKKTSEWNEYCDSGKLPKDIPFQPRNTYKKEWKGVGDWLGTGTVATYNRKYKSFEKSKEFIHRLNFKSITYWKRYCDSGKLPKDIPLNPPSVYEKQWISWGDFLGTGTIATQNREYLSPQEAKPILKKLFKEYGIKNRSEWLKFAKIHGKLLRELNIPTALFRIYSLENAKKKLTKKSTGKKK